MESSRTNESKVTADLSSNYKQHYSTVQTSVEEQPAGNSFLTNGQLNKFDENGIMNGDFLNQLRQKDQIIEQLESQILELRNKSSAEAVVNVNSENNDKRIITILREKLRTAAAHLRHLTEENSSLQTQVNQHNELVQSNTELQANFVKFKEETLTKQEQDEVLIKQLESSLKHALDNQAELQEEIEDLKKVKIQNDDQSVRLHEKIRSLEGKISILPKESSIQTEEKTEELKSNNLQLSYRITRLLQENNQMVLEKEQIIQEFNSLKNTHEKTQMKNLEKADKISEFESKYNILVVENSTLKKEINQLTHDLNVSKVSIKELSSSFQSMVPAVLSPQDKLNVEETRQLKEQLKSQLDSAFLDNKELKVQISRLYEEIKVKEQQIQTLHETISSFKQQQLLEKDDSVSSRHDHFAELENKFRNLELNMKETESRHIDTLREEKNQHQGEIENILQQHQQERKYAHDRIESLMTKQKSLEQDIQNYTEVMKKLKLNQETLEPNQHDVHIDKNDYEKLREEYDSLCSDVDKLKQDNSALHTKLNTVKTTIGPRLQAEMAENQTLKARIRELEESLQATQLAFEQSQQSISYMTESQSTGQNRYDSIITTLRHELQTLQESYSKSQRDVQRLRQHLLEAEEIATQEAMRQEDVLKEFRMQIEALTREKSEWEAVVEQERDQMRRYMEDTEESSELIEKLRHENQQLKVQIQSHSSAMANLQLTLEEFQAVRDEDFKKLKTSLNLEIEETKKKLEEFRNRTAKAEFELSKIDTSISDIEQMQQELAERNVLVGKLRHDLIQCQAHLSEAMRKMSSDDTVDRRLIANLVVQYVSAPRGERTRYEMLNVISGILKFTQDERYKCGLGSSLIVDSLTRSPTDVSNDNFADMWISFLMQETSADQAANSPISPITRKGSLDYSRRNSGVWNGNSAAPSQSPSSTSLLKTQTNSSPNDLSKTSTDQNQKSLPKNEDQQPARPSSLFSFLIGGS